MSFDTNNVAIYKLVGWAIGLGSVLIIIKTVFNHAAPFGPKQLVACALLGASAVSASLVSRSRLPSSALAVASVFFAAGGWLTVLAGKAAAIIAASSLLILVLNLVMGDEADVDTPKKKIKIRLPW